MALNDRFAEMQGKLDKPSCFGKFGEPGKKVCGMCWFWPKCKGNKKTQPQPKKKAVKEQPELIKDSE